MSEPADTKRIKTLEEYSADDLRRHARMAVKDLRGLADSTERWIERIPDVGSPGIPSYSYLASVIVKEIMWGLANLSIQRLGEDAASADVARAQEPSS